MTNPPRFSRWLPWGIVLITLAVYWPVATFQFVTYDDPDFVTANPRVQAGLTAKSFLWAWHSEVARNWHPVTMLTHMLDCQLFGLHPAGPHLVNLLWHAANTVLLFFLLQRMTGAVWRGALVAALFAWHPLHVESVAWVAERKDVLSTFFWLAATFAYVRYTEEKGRRGSAHPKKFYSLALFLFALGLLCKPMLVTLPFTLLLLDYWPLRRCLIAPSPRAVSTKVKARPVPTGTPLPRLVLEKIPFFILSAVSCVITYSVQQHGGAILGVNTLSIGARMGNALVSYVRYLGKMLWPQNLAALYLRPGGWAAWQVALAALALLALTAFALAQVRRRPYLAVGWFWYLGTLVPVIGLVQAGMQSMADRYTYLPLVGIFVMIAWGGEELLRGHPAFAFGAAGVALAACVAATSHQLTYWKDSETLYQRMIAVVPGNYVARYNLGNLYWAGHRANDASAEYAAALQAEPNYADAHNNFGGLLLDSHRYDEAISHYRAALRLDPKFIRYFNLANALADAASARHDPNEFAEAFQNYSQALQLNPASSEAHHNLGLALQAQGRDAEAIAEFQEVTQLDPNNSDAWNTLALSLAMANKMEDAAAAFRVVVRLRPGDAGACGNLGNALAAQNKFDQALAAYLTALKLNSNDYQTEFNLALSLSREGKIADAAAHCQQALRINPNYEPAQRALADLRARQGK